MHARMPEGGLSYSYYKGAAIQTGLCGPGEPGDMVQETAIMFTDSMGCTCRQLFSTGGIRLLVGLLLRDSTVCVCGGGACR